MIPVQFEYSSAKTLKDALKELKKKESYVLYGGVSLIRAMNHKEICPELVVDIQKVVDLKKIDSKGKILSVGSMVTLDELKNNEQFTQKCPLLSQAIQSLIDPQVVNQATLGECLAYSEIHDEIITACLTLDAEVSISTDKKEKKVSIEEFLKLQKDGLSNTLIVSIDIKAEEGRIDLFQKIENDSDGFALACIAASITKKGDEIKACAISAGGALQTPVKLDKVAQAIIGKKEFIAEIAGMVAQEKLDLKSDTFASAEYREHLICVLLEKIFKEIA